MNEQQLLGKLKAPGLELSVSVASHCLLIVKVKAKFRGENYDHSTVLYCNTCPVCGKHIFQSNDDHIAHIGSRHPLLYEPLLPDCPIAFRVYITDKSVINVCVDLLNDDSEADTYSLQVSTNYCPRC